MKKIMSAAAAVILLAACNPATGPGNKEPDNNNDNIEQENYRGNDFNNQNNRNQDQNRNRMEDRMNNGTDNHRDNNLNRKQFNDEGPGINGNDDLGPEPDNMDRNEENMVR